MRAGCEHVAPDPLVRRGFGRDGLSFVALGFGFTSTAQGAVPTWVLLACKIDILAWNLSLTS
jgi:hypothetical protein